MAGVGQRLEQRLGPVTVLESGARDHRRQQQSEGVQDDVAFAAAEFLYRIEAGRAGPYCDRSSYGGGIDDCRGRVRGLAVGQADPALQRIEHSGACADPLQDDEVVEHREVWREIARQRPPSNAVVHDLENRVRNDLSAHQERQPQEHK